MIVSSIDIGTNTVILLVAEVNLQKKEIIPLYNEQRIPRIGKGLQSGGNIQGTKIGKLLSIMSDYKKIIDEYGCEERFVIGTNALRIAANGREIVNDIKNKFEMNLEIIDGEKEAHLSFLGAVFELEPQSRNLVIDIGGGSTEIIYGTREKIEFKKSTKVGVVSASEEFLIHNPTMKSEINKLNSHLEQLFKSFQFRNQHFDNAIAIAGTPTTLAAIQENLEEFDEQKIEGHYLNKGELKNLIETIAPLSYDEILREFKSVVRGREDVILAGTIILFHLMRQFGIDKIRVSTKGIRYGKIVDELFK